MCKNQKVVGADVQKDLNWMAGSITRKLRGVRAKFRADLEIFLNVGGLRVYFKETEGLLCKSGSTDYFPGSLTRAGNESGPLDLHRAV